jgi:hypothetical protein
VQSAGQNCRDTSNYASPNSPAPETTTPSYTPALFQEPRTAHRTDIQSLLISRILTLVFVRIVDQMAELINSLKVAIFKNMKILLDYFDQL